MKEIEKRNVKEARMNILERNYGDAIDHLVEALKCKMEDNMLSDAERIKPREEVEEQE